jgi:hypothetical protein
MARAGSPSALSVFSAIGGGFPAIAVACEGGGGGAKTVLFAKFTGEAGEIVNPFKHSVEITQEPKKEEASNGAITNETCTIGKFLGGMGGTHCNLMQKKPTRAYVKVKFL